MRKRKRHKRVECAVRSDVYSDYSFKSKARAFQSKRRFETGAHPGTDANGEMFDNLAADGIECNRNFLTEEIFQYAKERVANKKRYETINTQRLFCNFLSSQAMAFNLFHPLMQIVRTDEGQTRVAAVVKNLLSAPAFAKLDRITEVGIEFIPTYWKECLNDMTAMDAYFIFNTTDGCKGIIAIETKYTDYLGNNEAKDRRPAINAINELKEIFTDECIARVNDRSIKITQIYRNFLLTEKVRQIEKLDDSLSIVIAPFENTVNKRQEVTFKAQLKPEYGYKFQVITLEGFVEALRRKFPEEKIFEDFYKRYLDFAEAEE